MSIFNQLYKLTGNLNIILKFYNIIYNIEILQQQF